MSHFKVLLLHKYTKNKKPPCHFEQSREFFGVPEQFGLCVGDRNFFEPTTHAGSNKPRLFALFFVKEKENVK
jgi:hypothetical protein